MQNDQRLRKLIKTFSVNNRTNSNVVIEEIEEPTPRKIEELKAKILTLETYIRNVEIGKKQYKVQGEFVKTKKAERKKVQN